jgi:hypothetical protein
VVVFFPLHIADLTLGIRRRRSAFPPLPHFANLHCAMRAVSMEPVRVKSMYRRTQDYIWRCGGQHSSACSIRPPAGHQVEDVVGLGQRAVNVTGSTPSLTDWIRQEREWCLLQRRVA